MSTPTSTPAPSTLAIAVLTYRRPADITRVLPLLVEQARLVSGQIATRVVVIDNDATGSAGEAVAEQTALAAAPTDGQAPIEISYRVESTPGIAAARNAALDACAGDDLMVFIDDDETPYPQWLPLLLATYEDCDRPAAVVGSVESAYDVEPSGWVAAGRFFDRRRLPTGTPVDTAATNNLFLDLRQVREIGLRFDERFGLTGGEDTMFTRTLHRSGRRLVWCNEARVIDRVPESRITPRWVLQRALSSGNSGATTSLALARNPKERNQVRLRFAGQGVARVGGGLGQAAFGLVTRKPAHQARGLRTAARGGGMLMGLTGVNYQEYKRSS